jgi:Secretion system C-terminal sorting domain
MKKILSLLLVAVSLLSSFMLEAQTFTIPSDPTDTVYTPALGGAYTVYQNIKNITGSNVNIKWKVSACNFPADWLSTLQICDRDNCRPSTLLWNISTGTVNSYIATYHSNSTHDSTELFSVAVDLSTVTSTGTSYYITVNMVDQGTGSYTKNLTIIFNRQHVAVNNVATSASDLLMYPNPAKEELNVVYEGVPDIKNIAVYNIIGKVMAVYHVNETSANLNLENVPSGIYFVRLLNSQGNVVVTKKFTKQ